MYNSSMKRKMTDGGNRALARGCQYNFSLFLSWDPTLFFKSALIPELAASWFHCSGDAEDHLSPGRSSAASSAAMKASPAISSIPQALMAPSENGTLGLEWRRGLHEQGGVQPDFR